MWRHEFFVFICIFLFQTLIHTFVVVDARDECPLAQNGSCLSELKVKGGSERKKLVYRPWISQIMTEVEKNFHAELFSCASRKCREDISTYKLHLKNSSIWAIRMLESTEWPRTGIFSGTTHHLGNYDECLMISYRTIKGRYCLVQAYYDFEQSVPEDDYNTESTDVPNQDSSVWRAIKMYHKNPARRNRQELKWAMCIPSSCKNTDLEASLRNSLSVVFKTYNMEVTVKVDPKQCYTKDMNKPSGYYYTRNLLYTILALVVLATGYELKQKGSISNLEKKNDPLMKIFKGFSVIDNYKKLKNFTPEREYILIHTQKVISMIFIIMLHRVIVLSPQIFDSERLEINYDILFRAGSHIAVVDIFFFFSGFFMLHTNYSKICDKGSAQVLVFIVHRYLRLIPTFAMVILFFVYILPHTNDGPLWHMLNKEVELCKSNWLHAILGVNNIFDGHKLCFWVSWYISVDFQLTVIGSILVLILTKHRNLGLAALVSTMVISVVSTYNYVVHNNCIGVIRFVFRNIPIIRSAINEFYGLYITLPPRVGPYIMGILSAFTGRLLKNQKFNFSKAHIIIASILTITVGEYGGALYGLALQQYDRPYNQVENAVYAAVHRSLFVLPFAYINCMYLVNGFKRIENLIPGILVILSRLGYCVYLVNTVIYQNQAFSQRSSLVSSQQLNAYWLFGTDFVFVHCTAFFLHLFIEAPLKNITQLIVQNLSRVLEEGENKLKDSLKDSERYNKKE